MRYNEIQWIFTKRKRWTSCNEKVCSGFQIDKLFKPKVLTDDSKLLFTCATNGTPYCQTPTRQYETYLIEYKESLFSDRKYKP